MVKSAKGRSAPATRGGRRAQTDVEESMADCIAEVDDVTAAVFRLFVNTPDSVPENNILNFVKEEVFGISDGRPIIDKDHPVMVETFAQDIIGGTLLIPVCTLFTRLLLRMS